MKTRFFASTMAGAPVLSGTAGSLIAILDACLVNGFGLQTATSVVVTGTTAVATFAAAPAAVIDSVVLVAGATPTGLNGNQRVTAVTSTTVSWTTTAAAGTATGTITIRLAAAGWAKTFTGTNLAAYKSLAPESTGCLLRVEDTTTTTALIRGFETMSDVSTGTGLFPNLAQFAAAGLFVSKSNGADTTARPGFVIADDRSVYYFVRNIISGTGQFQGNFFGDIVSFKSADPFACVIKANTIDRSPNSGGILDELSMADNSRVGSTSGGFIARQPNNIGGSTQVFHTVSLAQMDGGSSNYLCGAVGMPYPSPVDNGLMLAPMTVFNSTGYRGTFPGLMSSPMNVRGNFTAGQVVEGSGTMVGKKVMAILMGNFTGPTDTNAGTLFIDHIGPWRT